MRSFNPYLRMNYFYYYIIPDVTLQRIFIRGGCISKSSNIYQKTRTPLFLKSIDTSHNIIVALRLLPDVFLNKLKNLHTQLLF